MPWKSSTPSPLCPACSRSSYPAESYMAADRTPYHLACLMCHQCSKKLTPATLAEHDKQLYCSVCYQEMFIHMADNLPAARRKMQVLPVGGKYDKEALEFGAESEYRRREEAVQATIRTMKEKAKEAALGQGTQTYVKIKETVAICI
eukprot:GFUD01015265.1.p2 GENE.GFUD01015265.1~~GFUD01015265.1.p2  ORF type:complete len:165 (-),score=48.34 GFUD01015265.1:16-456(-)